MTRLVLATGNPDKAREITPLLREAGVDPVVAGELIEEWEVEETGSTLEENARIKATAAVDATGLPALADDTGLFVDVLDGAPGVRSSRYAGERASYERNVTKLLGELSDVPADRRSARFRTVAVLARVDGEERRFEGVLEGCIVGKRRGGSGFGYDPVFEVAGAGRTLAEMSLEEKNRISHRARALRAVADFLAANPGWARRVV
ncbi:MAG: RdgB/HAM1 family non-canonical purine NTP pyrophosphatase [Gemmatimonadota bacterium]|nr:RdgB/HAM1 family non-canonical purine NTP pyrophosphatase [Gemmatimonadota bacterium]